jgi:hypothetical protein
LAWPLLLAPWSLLGSYLQRQIASGINSVLPLVSPFANRGASDADLSRAPASIAALTLAIAGVAYPKMPRQLLVGYRESLALAIGILWIITEWVGLDQKQARVMLVWTQTLHRAAVLITINIMLIFNVQRLMPTPAIVCCF